MMITYCLDVSTIGKRECAETSGSLGISSCEGAMKYEHRPDSGGPRLSAAFHTAGVWCDAVLGLIIGTTYSREKDYIMVKTR